MIYLYAYLATGLGNSIASYFLHKKGDRDIAEEVQDKLHELNNDNSFSFKSANLIGHLLAFILGTLFWPILVLKKILRK